MKKETRDKEERNKELLEFTAVDPESKHKKSLRKGQGTPSILTTATLQLLDKLPVSTRIPTAAPRNSLKRRREAEKEVENTHRFYHLR